MSADLALLSGKVLTMNPSQPSAEAIAVKSDKIVKVGTNEEITQHIGKNTKVINLKGKTVVPGFIDTHIHVADFGRFLAWVDLRDVKSIKEMQNRIRMRAKSTPKRKWILGHGWDQTRLIERRSPTLLDLDEASPDNPIVIYHQCGRICAVNSEAIKLAGVTNETRNPPAGDIDKDAETGKLTGILRENATDLVWKVIPEPGEEENMEAIGLACEKIMEAGVTSVHWMVSSATEIPIIQRLRLENKLPLRIYIIIPVNLLSNVTGSGLFKDNVDNLVRIGGVEIFADGYLSAKTAALLQPYSDDSATSGELLCTQEQMNALAVLIHEARLQLVIHATGDKAVDAALATIEQTSNEAPEKGLRCRIEQAAVLNEGLLERMKKQNVIVSVQPRVIASEFSVWSATDHLGPKRALWLYPLRKLLREGIRIIGGSDCPMEPLSPLLGTQAAVTRESFPQERITVDEALRIYTVNAAYSSNEERVKGSIEEGKLADLTVLSRNPRAIPLSKIEDVKVRMTIMGGKVVYPKSFS
jgi:predicted amidohydrolase YtcJ